MKSTLLVAASLFAAATASAGVHVENVTRNIQTKAPDGAPHVTLIQDGAMKASSGKQNSMIIKANLITIVDDGKKTYMQMTKEEMKKMASQASAAINQMQEKMKNMTPEQRAMMEKMMGGSLPGGLPSDKPDVWDAKNTGKSDTVEGHKCAVWNLSRNGKLFEEMCVVPFKSLPGKEDVEKSFKELAEAFSEFTKGIDMGNSVQVRTQIDGYPVRTRSYDANGKLRGNETVLTKWVEESVPASAFEVPKGYTKKEMPQFGKKK